MIFPTMLTVDPNRTTNPGNALASNALYRYRNAVLRNYNALFDFQMTLFYVLDNLVFAVS